MRNNKTVFLLWLAVFGMNLFIFQSGYAAKNVIRVIQTAKETGDRLKPLHSLLMTKDDNQDIFTIQIDDSKKFQKIEGFGGTFTESGAAVLDHLSKKKRAEIINAYFHPQKGLGYRLCRTHINSCGFSLSDYSYNDAYNDTKLKYFMIYRDHKFLIPFIKQAQKVSGGKFKLLASPWSPPAWMKTNRRMNNGGKLKDNYRDVWALYFAKYIKAYAAAGIKIWGITVQNEPEASHPWESCLYSAEEERDFVKNYLGPRLAAEGLSKVKIIIWDHNKDRIFERAQTVLSDPGAAQYVWGIGFHWYSGDEFENLAKTHERFPDKHLLLTEASLPASKINSWESGEIYAHEIIGDLNNWAVGFIDFNMVLDQEGGPNHYFNYSSAPIIADTTKDTLQYQSSYYYLGHFSKYIKPGSVRIGCVSDNNLLETTAFKTPKGDIIIVVLNRSDSEIPFKIKHGQMSAKTVSPPHSIITLIY